ncbi:acetyltransferase [Desulfosporosinus acidiphilus SJ4]|uniref:Acetyltransferase n=1 Tax=Desulfosporosinus acidiphilus (strain DSM 22704 / JCM 16185 / SJ4) TaxID=646529 RepID=I4D9M3_DESAJ|nr:GNAT family N-acetyltransferase [Desulfosporosinus acidiphilus]AFM42497.1 acetyltransferase [Desulfosporosinus acidiphilus SJ4]
MERDKSMKQGLIAVAGETEHLLIRDSVFLECEELQRMNEASDYLQNWVGWKTPEDYASKTLTEGNLPPGGTRDRFRAKSLYLKQTSKLIGVLELYHGYPQEEVLWIGWLFIHSSFQRRGYAQETVEYLFSEAKKANFKKIRVGVGLKNWPALRFWYRNGFRQLVGIIGDKVYSERTFASIGLEKDV